MRLQAAGEGRGKGVQRGHQMGYGPGVGPHRDDELKEVVIGCVFCVALSLQSGMLERLIWCYEMLKR